MKKMIFGIISALILNVPVSAATITINNFSFQIPDDYEVSDATGNVNVFTPDRELILFHEMPVFLTDKSEDGYKEYLESFMKTPIKKSYGYSLTYNSINDIHFIRFIDYENHEVSSDMTMFVANDSGLSVAAVHKVDGLDSILASVTFSQD